MLSTRVRLLNGLKALHSHTSISNADSNSYLQVLFPLIACGFSFSYLAYQASQQFRKPSGYKAIGSDDDGPDTVPESYGLPDEEDGASIKDDDESEELTLAKTISRTNVSVIELDRPRGEVAWVGIEVLALLGQLSVNIAALIYHSWGNHGLLAAGAQVAV